MAENALILGELDARLDEVRGIGVSPMPRTCSKPASISTPSSASWDTAT